ncbi:unnamed protein product [Darwinula stevensoni]|uniref:Uncharacterized protein n=1 Tax=Darwinula stevensoni TaxID=69355 RepID=A0A7R9FR04_9CRUS|nr:unnamed protein product [Darwinula stevensoni]CAG0900377.1 unnamed protein product [Darwinula stevensoni]
MNRHLGRKKTRRAWNVMKAIVILGCTVLALEQVVLLVEEYLSFPTNTLYVIEDVEEIPAPAFTFCPKPSVTSRFPPSLNSSYEVEAFLGGATFVEKFKKHAISLEFMIHTFTNDWMLYLVQSTVNGETIKPLYLGNDQEGIPFAIKIEVYVHDEREAFTYFHFFEPEQVILFDNSLTRLFIRPEVIQKRNKRTDPCIDDDDYSYTRACVFASGSQFMFQCKENCIWEKMQARDNNLARPSCLMPSLLTKEANLTIPECKNWKDETHSFSLIPHFLEKEKVTLLDLLSNIGGIVGICLGASLITLFDIAEMNIVTVREPLLLLLDSCEIVTGITRFRDQWHTIPNLEVGENDQRPSFSEAERQLFHEGFIRWRKTRSTHNIRKSIFILGCSVLALKQVMLLIEEYLLVPTNTLYVIEDADKIPAPAFTFCPRPSVTKQFPPRMFKWEEIREFLNGSTYAEAFNKISVSLHQLIVEAPNNDWLDLEDKVTVNGETIMSLRSGMGHWSERIYPEKYIGNEELGGYLYFKCFTLHLKREIPTGTKTCRETLFQLNLTAITNHTEARVEVYVHDVREAFTNSRFFEPEQVLLPKGTINRIFIRPVVIQRQSRRTDPCVMDEDYSSTRIPHFLEKEKVTLLDLLSNIGGIVGVCLGASLITLIDFIEKCFLSHRKHRLTKFGEWTIKPEVVEKRKAHQGNQLKY